MSSASPPRSKPSSPRPPAPPTPPPGGTGRAGAAPAACRRCRPPRALAAYLAERAESGLCYGTLDGACSAIAHRHHQEGLVDPTADPVVARVRRGLRRIMGTAPRRQAHPLTVAELAQIVASIDTEVSIGVRDRAVLLLGYAAALRPMEIAALHLADVTVEPHGLLITIRRSKTDQEGHGQLAGVAAGLRRATDPIRALGAWLDLRPIGQGPLFTRVPAARPVTRERYRAPHRQRPRPQPRPRRRPRRPRHQRPLSARWSRHNSRRKRRPDRPDRRPDPTPRSDHLVQPLHPTRRRARDHYQPRLGTLRGLPPGSVTSVRGRHGRHDA